MARNTWPIIIGGCHRSGTSLVRRILNAHSRIHCGPEVKFFRDFYGDYPSDPLRHLRFISSARTILREDDLLELLGGAFVELHERAAAQAGKPRWADKNPENVLYLDQWQRLLGDHWLMIHVVRNPLDTLASIKEIEFPLTIPAGVEARIDFYLRYVEAGLRFGVAHPDRYCRVMYEQLVASPRPVLDKLMYFLAESFEEGQLKFNEFPQQAGLEDPKIACTRGIHDEAVGRWQSILAHEEACIIWRETRRLWSLVDPNAHFDVAEDPSG